MLRMKTRKTDSNLRRLRTEQPNQAAADLDRKSSLEIARLINTEDATVAAAVARVLPQIARAIDLVAAASPPWTPSSARPRLMSILAPCSSSSPEAPRL
jgi:hypothetical protein